MTNERELAERITQLENRTSGIHTRMDNLDEKISLVRSAYHDASASIRELIELSRILNDRTEMLRKMVVDLLPTKESLHEQQDNVLPERSRKTANQPTTGDNSPGYLESQRRVHSCELHGVVQRWVDQNPEWFRSSMGEYWPIPTGVNPAIFTGLELALMRAAEELRRRRNVHGPESNSYPQLSTQRTNAQTQFDKS